MRRLVERLESLVESKPGVGTEWDSVQGRRKVVGKGPKGMLLVKTDGQRFEELVAADQLAGEIDFDTRQLASQQKMNQRVQARRDSETKAKAVHDDTDGFADSLPPRARAKAIEALNKNQKFNGVLMSRKEFVRQAVTSGARVQGSGARRRLEFVDESFMLTKDITKTAMDYAEWLGKHR